MGRAWPEGGDWSGERWCPVPASRRPGSTGPSRIAVNSSGISSGERDADGMKQIRQEAASWEMFHAAQQTRPDEAGPYCAIGLALYHGRDRSPLFTAPADTKISWIHRDARNATVSMTLSLRAAHCRATKGVLMHPQCSIEHAGWPPFPTVSRAAVTLR